MKKSKKSTTVWLVLVVLFVAGITFAFSEAAHFPVTTSCGKTYEYYVLPGESMADAMRSMDLYDKVLCLGN